MKERTRDVSYLVEFYQGKPVPMMLVGLGLKKEIKAYSIILNEQLGIPADMLITENMMLAVIKAYLLSGEAETGMRQEIGPARFDGIVGKYEERVCAQEIMFGITPGQVKEVVLKI